MRAWHTRGDARLVPVDLPMPQPAPGEVLVRVEACGVCRTDLHVIAGELPQHRSPVVPGHEIVGRVVDAADDLGPTHSDARVGVPWLRGTCGHCARCLSGAENLCRHSHYTGWDADGGYAEYVVAPVAYTYPVPESMAAERAAPLLCAGIIGYRALKRAQLPPAGRLGLYGFGASAHLTAQIAQAQGAEVHVVTRGAPAQRLARELGAASVGGPGAPVPPLDAAIVFAPAGAVVAEALGAVGPGGTVAVAGIHVSAIPSLDYRRQLFDERTLTSVTSNTRADGAELLRLASRLGVEPRVVTYPLGRAHQAVRDHAADPVRGGAPHPKGEAGGQLRPER